MNFHRPIGYLKQLKEWFLLLECVWSMPLNEFSLAEMVGENAKLKLVQGGKLRHCLQPMHHEMQRLFCIS